MGLARPVAGQTSRPVAYFCSEFGAHCSLALYGGGLGVLAGDTLKAAADLAVPMVGVGLFYRQGYFHQRLDLDGWQREYWINADFERLPAVRVTGADQRPLTVEVEMRGRVVHCDIWRIDLRDPSQSGPLSYSSLWGRRRRVLARRPPDCLLVESQRTS